MDWERSLSKGLLRRGLKLVTATAKQEAGCFWFSYPGVQDFKLEHFD